MGDEERFGVVSPRWVADVYKNYEDISKYNVFKLPDKGRRFGCPPARL
jgi:hypothetical protein